MSLPSELRFASFLQYSPREPDKVGCASRDVCYAIKSDGLLRLPQPDGSVKQVRAIENIVGRIARRLAEFAFLREYLGPDVVLVPMPRSAPLGKDALWPPKRVCEALVANGLGREVVAAVERIQAVQKSSTAGQGGRPGAREHHQSMQVVKRPELALAGAKKITLVDDVVTRGATFVGAAAHILAAFPKSELRCFALVRTQSSGAIENVIAPVEGTITFVAQSGWLRRAP